MNLRHWEYLIQEAFTGIKRNGLMAFATITTIALSVGVLGAFVITVLAANSFAATQIGKFQIAVHMTSKADMSDAEATAEKIRKYDDVQSVTIRSRDKEWAEFKLKYPDFESAGLPLNVLPYSIDVKVSNPERTSIIASKIRTMKNIDVVREGKAVLKRVMAVARVVKAIGIFGVIVLLITTIFIISNAIRLTLYARRREIRIMQLVGATNEFIRIPLVLEGIVFGIAGSTVAWILLRIATSYVSIEARKIMPLLERYGSGLSDTELAFGLIFLGAAIGAIGSIVSIRRFLRD